MKPNYSRASPSLLLMSSWAHPKVLLKMAVLPGTRL